MLTAICTYTGYTLDGTDGKQARRIGASGPVGELCESSASFYIDPRCKFQLTTASIPGPLSHSR